jgi:hypothetical protein
MLISFFVYLAGIAVGFAAWHFDWPAMPLYTLILLFPSLYLLDYYSTTQGLLRGQEEANPIFGKYFLTGNLRKDLIIPLIAMAGLAIYLGTNTDFIAASYLFLGLYLGVFINNGLCRSTTAAKT